MHMECMHRAEHYVREKIKTIRFNDSNHNVYDFFRVTNFSFV